eukprot:Seg2695.4 transcript_id=Seg2695.4/GoldUCD/mRNA.D3Y31 product="Cell cycle checkpoint protein RAD17" protein_id=Seg2695.4/GoldUCD/D3Y31
MSVSKRKPDWISSSFGDFATTQATQSNSKRSVKRKHSEKPFQKQGPASQNQDLPNLKISALPWSEKYQPTKEIDLAVHKKKVADVKNWLLTHLTASKNQNYGNILVLTGPAGSGKSATIDVLSRDLDIELQEWNTPVSSTHEEYATWKDFRILSTDSQKKQFQDFLLRANKYPTLSISGKGSSSSVAGKKIVLVEDIPNVFYRNTRDFHDILRQFQATSRNPLVFIISDSYVGESSLYTLFPKKIQIELKITCMSFNSIANTSVMKTMTKIVNTESQNRRDFKIPKKDTLDLLAASSAGDIRACINSLQFYCTNEYSSGNQNTVASSRKEISKKTQGSRNKGKSTNKDQEEKISLFGRDTSLFLFKALGKILYCKRDPLPVTEKSKQLPAHLQHHLRDRLLIDPEVIIEKTHVQNDTFNLYLHQNYLGFYSTIDDVANASNHFSEADFITGLWSTREVMTNYSSSLATRGVIFANSQRSNSTSGSVSGGWRPLHKPQWFEAFKEANSNKRTAEDLFHDLRHPAVDLHTEVLPYLAKTNVPLRTPSHISFVQMFSHFNINMFHTSSALDQLANDAVEAEETESEAATSNVRTEMKQGNENSVTLSQLVIETQGNSEEIDTFEENLIEDFSDDDGLYDILLE